MGDLLDQDQLTRAYRGLFFLSGFCALIYEVLWERRLSLILGHSAFSTATVLTLTMGGLAAGSLLGGRKADGVSSRVTLIRGYGFLELLIGVWGCLSPLLLDFLEKGLLTVARFPSEIELPVLGGLGALLTLLPATTAMGATLPVVVEALRDADNEAGIVGTLYGWNTLGAVLGAFAAGYLLLPAIGFKFSVLAAGTINLAVGALALRSSSHLIEDRKEVPSKTDSPSGRAEKKILLGLAFLIGSLSMSCQVAWSRGLLLSLGSSVYAFSSTLASFLAALAVGGFLSVPFSRRLGKERLLSLACLGACLGVFWSMFAIGRLPELFLKCFAWVGESFPAQLFLQLGLSSTVVIPAALCFGVILPTLATDSMEGANPGRGLGQALACNTLGCVAGAWLTGFFGIPRVGLGGALQATLLLAGLSALFSWWRGFGKRSTFLVGLPLIGITMVFAPDWPKDLLTAGVAVYGQDYLEGREVLAKRAGTPAFYRDGISSTVSIHVSGAYLTLKVNGKVDASLHPADRQTMYLTGYLAGLFCPEPKRAAVIGLGSGMTLQALSHFPSMTSIECAEIEPAVVEAQKFWLPHNGHVIEDSRVTIKEVDGRRFILGASEGFDVIASEPSNPWIAGVGNLYTREFYRYCKERLEAHGVMAQWFHLYSVTNREIGIVVRTFYSEFPHGQVWITASGDLVLLGSLRPLVYSRARVQSLYNGSETVKQVWFDIDLYTPDSLLGHYLMGREQMLRSFPGRELNTDDLPLLEFLAPRHLYKYTAGENLTRLFLSRTDLIPAGITPSNDLLLRAADGWLSSGNLRDVRALLSRCSIPGTRLLWARLLTAGNASSSSLIQAFREASIDSAETAPADFLCGELYLRLKLWEEAGKAFSRAAEQPWPGGDGQVFYGLGLALFRSGDMRGAEAAFERAAKELPSSAAWTQLGITRSRLGETEKSLQAFETALRINPFDVEAHLESGMAALAEDRFETGKKSFESVLRLMPGHKIALLNLGVCQAHLGETNAARRTFKRLLQIYPGNSSAIRNLRTLQDDAPK